MPQTQPTDAQMQAIVGIVTTIIHTVQEAGPIGAPGGVIYAAMMAHGLSLGQYEALMRLAVRSGKIALRGQCYVAVQS